MTIMLLSIRSYPSLSLFRSSFLKSFHSTPSALGRPFRRKPGKPVLHQSQRLAEPATIDFDSLNLKYPVQQKNPTFVVERTAWTPPPAAAPVGLPFHVDRSEIGKSLPVYTDYRSGGTKVQTILRKIKGDIRALKEEVEKVVGQSVEVRPGKIVISGNYHRRLKVWLTAMGF